MRVLIVMVAVVIVISLVAAAFGLGLFNQKPLDTQTHRYAHSGYYGVGNFVGELLQSDIIQTNVTDKGNMSQSIVFKGSVCPDIPQGRVFLRGAAANDADAYYRVYLNGVLSFSAPMEVGDDSLLTQCYSFAEKSYVITGSLKGSVRVDLGVYVFYFARGAGAYEVMASDQAQLA